MRKRAPRLRLQSDTLVWAKCFSSQTASQLTFTQTFYFLRTVLYGKKQEYKNIKWYIFCVAKKEQLFLNFGAQFDTWKTWKRRISVPVFSSLSTKGCRHYCHAMIESQRGAEGGLSAKHTPRMDSTVRRQLNFLRNGAYDQATAGRCDEASSHFDGNSKTWKLILVKVHWLAYNPWLT